MKRLIPGLALIALTLSLAHTARAQIWPDGKSFGVFQEGVLVGEVFRADLDSERYLEHWVLYPQYRYPSADNRIVTELRPGLRAYDGLDDFFRRVPFEKGSRYVKADCFDGTSLPGH